MRFAFAKVDERGGKSVDMEFFKDRNKLRAEYSGYQEISDLLRKRLWLVCDHYIHESDSYDSVSPHVLRHEFNLYFGEGGAEFVIKTQPYDDVFQALEIFLSIAKDQASEIYSTEILPRVQKVFDLSGSVYFVNDNGEVGLRVDEETARNVEEVKQVLSEDQRAYQTFFDSVGNLFGRKAEPKDIIKDIFVAFEDYLKDKTEEKEYGKAAQSLEKRGVISPQQKSLLEKIYAYRSSAYAVGHAGSAEKPEEVDALWFLETVIAQLKFLDRKLKNDKT